MAVRSEKELSAPVFPWWGESEEPKKPWKGLRPGPSLPAEGLPNWTVQHPSRERRLFAWPLNRFCTSRGLVRAEVIRRERQLPQHLGRLAPGSEPDGSNSRESGRRHFSIDCSGLGEGPTTKATAAATAAAAAAEQPWVGVCALVSEAQAEASAVAGAQAAERMTAAAVLF